MPHDFLGTGNVEWKRARKESGIMLLPNHLPKDIRMHVYNSMYSSNDDDNSSNFYISRTIRNIMYNFLLLYLPLRIIMVWHLCHRTYRDEAERERDSFFFLTRKTTRKKIAHKNKYHTK